MDGDVGVFLWVGCVWVGGFICLYGWDVFEGWECIGKEGEKKLLKGDEHWTVPASSQNYSPI